MQISAYAAPATANQTHDVRPMLTDGSQLLRRGVAVIGLAGIALVHVVDATGKFRRDPLPRLGGTWRSSPAASSSPQRRSSAMTGVLGMAAAAGAPVVFAAYALSRTTGLPAARGAASGTGSSRRVGPVRRAHGRGCGRAVCGCRPPTSTSPPDDMLHRRWAASMLGRRDGRPLLVDWERKGARTVHRALTIRMVSGLVRVNVG